MKKDDDASSIAGPMVISWKKRGPSSNEQQDQWLAIGKILYVSGPDADRFSVEIEPESKGSTLVIALAKPSDVGDYICQVSSNPPATLRHSVTMIGGIRLIDQLFCLFCKLFH